MYGIIILFNMLLMSWKHKKLHKLKLIGSEKKLHLTQLVFGSYGLKACESGRITLQQIETLRRGLSGFLKKNNAQIWFRHPLSFGLTQKPVEIRMGKGKGNITTHVMRLRAGTIFFELDGIVMTDAIQLLLQVQAKLCIKSTLLLGRRYR
jgi:large subunit ribosomal protein L16